MMVVRESRRARVVAALTTLGLLAGVLGCSPVVRVRPFSNDKIAYWTAEGGMVVSSYDKDTKTTRLCVAPPAQGARQKDLGGAVGGKLPKLDLEISANGTIDHQTQSLYDQSDAGLFFQFALYRLCEAYMNGAVSNEQYVKVYSCLVKEAAGLVKVENQYAEAAQMRAKYGNTLVVYDDKRSDDERIQQGDDDKRSDDERTKQDTKKDHPDQVDCWSTITGAAPKTPG